MRLDAIRTPRGDGNAWMLPSSGPPFRCNPQTPLHLPIPSRFASANRGASSKAARFFRHRRRFASFPSRGRQHGGGLPLGICRVDTIRTPRGDGNCVQFVHSDQGFWMQSAPLAGTATLLFGSFVSLINDAIPTPRGDGNESAFVTEVRKQLMQSAPLTGTATR